MEKKREIQYLSVQNLSLNSSLNVSINIKDLYEYIENISEILPYSILPIIIFELSRIISKYELFKSYFNGNRIFIHNNVNIGFAVEIEKPLRVLTLADADKKSLKEIEGDIINLTDKYINDELEKNDLINSTITVSDLSSTEVNSFIPLINKYQSAIIGIGKMDEDKGESLFTLNYDHRILSGKYASDFLGELKINLESYKLINEKAGNKKCFICSTSLEDAKKLNGFGLLKIESNDKNNKYICTNCLTGF